MTELLRQDEIFFRWIHDGLPRGPFFSLLMDLLSQNESLGLILVLMCFLCLWLMKKSKKTWYLSILVCLISMGLSDAFCARFLKPQIERLRPCQADSQITYGDCQSLYGFPSNHAANTMAVAVSLTFAFRQKKWFLLFIPLLFGVGLSRVFFGVHYPLDILGGWVVGAFFGAVMARLSVSHR